MAPDLLPDLAQVIQQIAHELNLLARVRRSSVFSFCGGKSNNFELLGCKGDGTAKERQHVSKTVEQVVLENLACEARSGR